jgi:hypothetical protein
MPASMPGKVYSVVTGEPMIQLVQPSGKKPMAGATPVLYINDTDGNAVYIQLASEGRNRVMPGWGVKPNGITRKGELDVCVSIPQQGADFLAKIEKRISDCLVTQQQFLCPNATCTTLRSVVKPQKEGTRYDPVLKLMLQPEHVDLEFPTDTKAVVIKVDNMNIDSSTIPCIDGLQWTRLLFKLNSVYYNAPGKYFGISVRLMEIHCLGRHALGRVSMLPDAEVAVEEPARRSAGQVTEAIEEEEEPTAKRQCVESVQVAA